MEVNSSLYLTQQELPVNETEKSWTADKEVVLDVLRTKLQDCEKEKRTMSKKLEEIRKEKNDEAELFKKKVQQLQEKFHIIENKVKEKGSSLNKVNQRYDGYSMTKEHMLKKENELLGREL